VTPDDERGGAVNPRLELVAFGRPRGGGAKLLIPWRVKLRMPMRGRPGTDSDESGTRCSYPSKKQECSYSLIPYWLNEFATHSGWVRDNGHSRVFGSARLFC
jgi:hypothetical protein